MDSLQKAIGFFRIITYLFLFYIVLNIMKPLFGIDHILLELVLALPGIAALVLSPLGLFLLLKGNWRSLSGFRKGLYIGGYLFYNLVCLLMILSFGFMMVAGPR